jgi:hypothetical protein
MEPNVPTRSSRVRFSRPVVFDYDTTQWVTAEGVLNQPIEESGETDSHPRKSNVSLDRITRKLRKVLPTKKRHPNNSAIDNVDFNPVPFMLDAPNLPPDRHPSSTRMSHENFYPEDAIPTTDRSPSPVLALLRPAEDYAKMDEPEVVAAQRGRAYISRLRAFIHHVYTLPWVAPRPTFDYYPNRPGAKPDFGSLSPLNWYAVLHRRSIDLLSGSSSPKSPPVPQRLNPDPDPEYEYLIPVGFSQVPSYAIPQGENPLYPLEYYRPQPVYLDTRPVGYMPLNSIQVYGPPISNHNPGHTYFQPAPAPWPYPPPAPPPETSSLYQR